MESNKPNEDDNPLDPTSLLQQHVHSRADNSSILRNVNNSGADFVQFPYMTVPFTPPWDNMNGSYPAFMHEVPATGGYPIAELMRHNTYQNPQFDLNSTDMQTDVPLVTTSGIANPSWNLGEIRQSVNHDYMVNPDSKMNCCIDYGGFQNSPMNENFMLPAKSSNDNSPLIHTNLPNLRGSGEPIFYHTQKSENTQMVDNNIDVNSIQFGCFERIDGSFLSLGTGGNTRSRSNPTFSRKEIASQLNSSHVPQTTRDFSSLGHNLNSGVSIFQGNGSGLERSASNLGGWDLDNNGFRTICGSNALLSSTAFNNLQAQQVNMQRNMSMSSNPGFVSKRQDAYANLDPHNNFRDDQVASSGAFIVNKPNELLSYGQFGSAPESANATDQVQNCYTKPKNLSAVSSMGSPFPGITNWNHSGLPLSTHDGNVAQAESHLFPKRIGLQPNEASCVAQVSPATGSSFPKRLGFQANDSGNHQVAAGKILSNRMGVQAASKGKVGLPSQKSGPIQSPKNVVSPTTIGRPRGTAPYQLPLGFRGPSSSTGQLQNALPSNLAKDLHRIPVSTPGQQIPVEDVKKPVPPPAKRPVGRPPLKRGASQPPAAAPTARRSKPTLRPPPPNPSPQKSPLRSPVPISTTAHIKWQAPEEVSEPVTEKCLLCKRGLSFTPEGAMHQPAAPPPVAVLNCGHTFHDHCLQLITPEDQAKDPPCIPCAIGDN